MAQDHRWQGLHVMAPLARKLAHDAAHAYALRLAQRLADMDADRYTTFAALARRPGRLFVDYLRNARGTTAIGAYSPRVRHGFPIAAPVNWKQVGARDTTGCFDDGTALQPCLTRLRRRWPMGSETSRHEPTRIRRVIDCAAPVPQP